MARGRSGGYGGSEREGSGRGHRFRAAAMSELAHACPAGGTALDVLAGACEDIAWEPAGDERL